MQLATAAAVWCNANDAGFEDICLAKRNTLDWAEGIRRARSAGASGLTFFTSGSTGKQQHIRHAEHSLMDEVPNLRRSACGGIEVLLPCGAMVPLALQDERP